jgi:hypothetical protein
MLIDRHIAAKRQDDSRKAELSMDRTTIRSIRWSWVAATAVLAPATAQAQAPVDPEAPPPVCNRTGHIHRLFHHTAHTVQDKMIGYPENFVEPPLGHYVGEQLTVQVAKADAHRFTLYKTDFLPGTSLFSPTGASRYNIMATRMPGWLGPITVEWTPEQPELAELRRRAIVDILLKAGQPVLAERVIIAPSSYPGGTGIEGINNYSNAVARGQTAAQGFALPPTETASMGVR